MPGIVGLITRMPQERALPELLRMVQALCHEPFYRMGTWTDVEAGVYVGWVVRKNSFADGMPLRNESGNVVLVFSGEEYSEPDVARRPNGGGKAVGAVGPSYLVHLCERDSTFPSGLNGRFHGLIVDRSRRTATLFNDRYGIHRIYHHQARDAFYFAAEAKAILHVCPELRNLDARSLGEFISCGCVLENRTLFEGIHVLPPASAWLFRNGTLERARSYFLPREWEEQSLLEPEAYYREIRDTFSRVLPRYFSGSQPIGMSLTGGLDSRMIMAWRRSPPDSLPCYSFAGMFGDCQDALVARHVAGASGQPHSVIQVGKEFLAQFPYYAERTVYLTDGCVSVSHSPDLYVNQRAAMIAPVRMTGNYGGEVLRQVRAFKPMPLSAVFSSELRPYIGLASKTYRGIVQGHPLSFAVFRQAPWHHYGLLALEETQLSLRSPYLDNDLVRTVFRAPRSALTSADLSLRLIADGNPTLARIRTDRGLGGDRARATAAVLRGLLEFSFKAEYAYDYGMPQWLARLDHCFSPLGLHRIVLGRHKFYHFRVWYREALAEYVSALLLDRQTLSRAYIDRKALTTAVHGHLRGTQNHTLAIHTVLTLELLHRLLLDREPKLSPIVRGSSAVN
jgi:asparagine synthase (glutamine-hydrolysing)